MNIRQSFWFSKIPIDVLVLIKYELYDLRAPIVRKKIAKELKKQWKKRKVWERLLDSYGKNIHEGRVFLYKNMRHLLHIYPIYGYGNPVYLLGMKLRYFHEVKYIHGLGMVEVHGCKLDIKKNMWKIMKMCEENGWENLREETTWFITQYLLAKENV